jgi:hypothetical protein
MDLLSSIRKEGSRGGVDFKWADVTTSQHRENYLGHSLMAPVGRWQKKRDLNWYAKADSGPTDGNAETAEERSARERREELRRIKEAEEDAFARALGLPVVDRSTNGMRTGANGIDVGEVKRVIKEVEVGDDEIEEVGRGRGFGDFVGKMNADGPEKASGLEYSAQKGGLVGADSTPRRVKRPARAGDRSRSRSRSRDSRDRRHRRYTQRERSRERDSGGRHRQRERDADSRPHERRNRSHSPHPRERQFRSRSIERRRERKERSRSPARKEDRRYRSRSRSSSPPRRRDERERDRDRDRDRRGSGAEYRAAQSRRSRPPDPRERDRESRRVGGERWR